MVAKDATLTDRRDTCFGIGVGKEAHLAYAVDSTGTVLLSQRIDNSESKLDTMPHTLRPVPEDDPDLDGARIMSAHLAQAQKDKIACTDAPAFEVAGIMSRLRARLRHGSLLVLRDALRNGGPGNMAIPDGRSSAPALASMEQTEKTAASFECNFRGGVEHTGCSG